MQIWLFIYLFYCEVFIRYYVERFDRIFDIVQVVAIGSVCVANSLGVSRFYPAMLVCHM